MILPPGMSLPQYMAQQTRHRRHGGSSMPFSHGGGGLGPDAPPAPGSIHIPGLVQGFYSNLLNSNPIYQQQLANLNAGLTGAASQRTSMIQRALADFGAVPAGFSDPYGDVNDLTRSLAEKATQAGTSFMGMLQGQKKIQDRSTLNDLAARGMLSSGETGYQLGQNQQGYLNTLNEAERTLLDQLTGAATGYGNAAVENAQAKGDAAQEAMNQILAMNPVAPSERARLLQQSLGPRGQQGWYLANGTLYNPGGQALPAQATMAQLRARIAQLRQRGIHGGDLRSNTAWRRLQLLKQYMPEAA